MKEAIQLPNTFRSKTPSERRTHLKQRHHNQNTTSRKPKGQFLSPKLTKWQSKIKKITRTHAKTYYDRNSKPQQKHLEWSVKYYFGRGVGVGGEGLKSILRANLRCHNPRPWFCRSEWFLTHHLIDSSKK